MYIRRRSCHYLIMHPITIRPHILLPMQLGVVPDGYGWVGRYGRKRRHAGGKSMVFSAVPPLFRWCLLSEQHAMVMIFDNVNIRWATKLLASCMLLLPDYHQHPLGH